MNLFRSKGQRSRSLSRLMLSQTILSIANTPREELKTCMTAVVFNTSSVGCSVKRPDDDLTLLLGKVGAFS